MRKAYYKNSHNDYNLTMVGKQHGCFCHTKTINSRSQHQDNSQTDLSNWESSTSSHNLRLF